MFIGGPHASGKLTLFFDFSRIVVCSPLDKMLIQALVMLTVTIPHDFPIVNKDLMEVKISGRYFFASFLSHNNVLM